MGKGIAISYGYEKYSGNELYGKQEPICGTRDLEGDVKAQLEKSIFTTALSIANKIFCIELEKAGRQMMFY